MIEFTYMKSNNEDKDCNRAERHNLYAEGSCDNVFNAIGDPICILDDRFRIVKANKAMADRLGLSPEECVGQTCYRLVHCVEQHLEPCPHAQTLKDGLSHTVEVYEENLGGYFLVSTSPLTDMTGKAIGSIHVGQDITERKKAEEEKEKLIKELQEALAKVRTLSGLLPMCSSCKKIRDDKGYWIEVERYISKRAEVDFSHAVCPECMKKIYPDQYKKIEAMIKRKTE
jgi:PAS domain S-box-containing protein